MSFPLWCLFFCRAIALCWTKSTGGPWPLARSSDKGYDNRIRVRSSGVTGWGARAMRAHSNMLGAFRCLPPVCLVAQVTTLRVNDQICWRRFYSPRIAYTALYLATGQVAQVCWGGRIYQLFWGVLRRPWRIKADGSDGMRLAILGILQ